MNQVTLLGNLTRNIEIKYSQAGEAYGKTAIAVNNRKNKSVMFMEIVFFSRLAEVANQYLRKGDKICIHGSLSLNQWTNQEGIKQQNHSVLVQDLEMISTKNASHNTPSDFPKAEVSMEDFDEDEIPF